ncbi:MAG: hypothetical protein ACTTH7_05340 [Treponema sp.]
MNLTETIQNHKIAVLGGALAVLILLMLGAVVMLIYEQKGPPLDPDEIIISIDPAVFVLPEEPLDLPPVQYSRKQKKVWTEADVQYWYTLPDAEQMKKLHDANEEKMKKLWESVP